MEYVYEFLKVFCVYLYTELLLYQTTKLDVYMFVVCLQNLVKDGERMCYPGSYGVPHDNFSPRDARRARQLAESILEKANQFFVSNT